MSNSNNTTSIEEMVGEIMQSGSEVAMGGDPFESEEWNEVWQQKEYDLRVTEYTNKIMEQINQAYSQGVTDGRKQALESNQ